jgi:hypothetical protein
MKERREEGQAILEFALMLPVFVLIGFGLVDIQWCIERAANLDYVVNETARCMGNNGQACSLSPATPTTYADNLAGGLGMTLSQMSLTPAPACNAQTGLCTVTGTYKYSPLGAWFPNITLKRIGTASISGNQQYYSCGSTCDSNAQQLTPNQTVTFTTASLPPGLYFVQFKLSYYFPGGTNVNAVYCGSAGGSDTDSSSSGLGGNSPLVNWYYGNVVLSYQTTMSAQTAVTVTCQNQGSGNLKYWGSLSAMEVQ